MNKYTTLGNGRYQVTIDNKDIIVKLNKHGNIVATTDTNNKYVPLTKKLTSQINYSLSPQNS